MCDMYADEPLLDFVVAEDLLAHAMQDTSLPDVLTAMLFHKGFTALTTYRLMHWLWRRDRQNLARYLQSICSEVGLRCVTHKQPYSKNTTFCVRVHMDHSHATYLMPWDNVEPDSQGI